MSIKRGLWLEGLSRLDSSTSGKLTLCSVSVPLTLPLIVSPLSLQGS
ncbi:hypothetical protein [Helicobacter bilis]|nr:hypothetical protein [Helicobacter bilis]